MTPADFLPFGQGAGLDDLPRSLPALMSMKSISPSLVPCTEGDMADAVVHHSTKCTDMLLNIIIRLLNSSITYKAFTGATAW